MGASTFRGAAGEVVRGFVHPRTLLTLVPVAVALGICGLPVMALVVGLAVPPEIGLPLAVVVVAPVVGRFALAARAGRLTAGFVEARPERGALLGFVARYLTLALVWSLPVVAGGAYLATEADVRSYAALAAAGGGPAAIVALAAGLLLLLLLLIVVVAVRAETAGETLRPAAWLWLLGERRGDVVVLAAALLGGTALFTLMAFPAGLLLEPFAAAVATDLGYTPLDGFPWTLPAVGALVLAGRLSGALAGDGEGLAAETGALRGRILAHGGVPTTVLSALTGAALPAHGPVRPAPEAETAARPGPAIARLATAPDEQLGAAILEAEQLMRMEPHKPNVAGELARLYQRAGYHDEARRVGGVAIARALGAGMPSVAAQVFHRFDPEERAGLALASAVLEPLGWVLLRRREIDAALWCFDAYADAGGEQARVEKCLVAVADAVTLAGDALRALALHRRFLRRFPGSALDGYVRSALLRLESETRRDPAGPRPAAS